MRGESFVQRVQSLRDAWSERREIKGLAGAHDFESQFRLLVTLHNWASEAVGEIETVYGDAVHIALSPPPVQDPYGTAFSVFVASQFTLTFGLTERHRLGGSRWSVSVSLGSTGIGGSAVAAGPERRNGHWTRGRLEDLLLSVLGAWERAQSEGDQAPTGERLRARGA